MSESIQEKLPSGLLESDEDGPAMFDETYFESETNRYWRKNEKGRFKPVTKADLREEWKDAVLESGNDPNPTLINAELVRVRKGCDVDYVGSLPGKQPGLFHNIDGKDCLITDGPSLIEPVKGEWGTIRRIFVGSLGAHQTKVLLTWLRQSITTLRDGHWQPAQALLLIGPAETVKSLIILILTQLLGGRSADAYKYMSGDTTFAGEFRGVEVLKLDDAMHRSNAEARNCLGATIKQLTTGSFEVSIPMKFKEPMRIRPFFRIVGALNDDEDCFSMLPPTTGSHRDKYILLKCKPTNAVPNANTGGGKTQLREQFQKEYPGLVHYLLYDFNPPVELIGGRMDVQAYHHPDLVAAIGASSPETSLLELIDSCWPHIGGFKEKWKGTATELTGKIDAAEGDHKAILRALTKSTNAIGILLGKLSKSRPDRVKIINRPRGSNQYELSGSPVKKTVTDSN